MDKQVKKVSSFRVDPELEKWITDYAAAIGPGVTRNSVLEALLTALREGRLWVDPDTRPEPFPGVKRVEILPVKPFQGVPPGTYPHRIEKEK